jgi:hypothetical protein
LSSAIFITLPHYGILEIEPDERSDGRPPFNADPEGHPAMDARTNPLIHDAKLGHRFEVPF